MSDVTENAETKPDAKPVEKAKPVKPKKEKRQTGGVRLPFLLELTYTLSTLILIFLALAIMITSIFAGASLFMVVLRTSAAIIVVGGVLMLISSQISSGLLFAAKIEQEEAEKKREEEEKNKQEEEPVFPGVHEEAEMAEA